MTPKRNDIIFSRIGTLGKVGIVKTDSDFLVSYSCCIIRSIAIEIDYLKYYLMGPIIQDHIKSAKTGIGVPDLGMNEIKKCLIPIPPINEQKRIVQELFKFGPLIDEYSIKWDALEKMNTSFPEHLKKSILQMAVQGKLVPQDPNDEPASVLLEQIRAEKESLIREGKIKRDKNESVIFRRDTSHYEKLGTEEHCIDDEIPFEIPDNWEWARLGTVSTYAQTKKKINAKDAEPNMWGLDLEDIEKGGHLFVKHKVGERKAIGDKTSFEKGDILYSKLRPYLLKVLVADEDGICTPEIVPFKVYGGIVAEYLVAYLKSPYVDSTINAATYGIKMPRAGTETMTALLVPLPPLSEQQRIVKRIKALIPIIESM